MIKLGSTSYPYLAVAKHFDISYGEVLAFVRMIEIDSVYKAMTEKDSWMDATVIAYDNEMNRRKQVLGV